MTDNQKPGCAGVAKDGYARPHIPFVAFPLPPILHANRLSRKLAAAEHLSAAKIRGFDYPSQLFSEVGRNAVTVMQSIFAHYEFTFGIENHKVCMVSSSEAAFYGVAAS